MTNSHIQYLRDTLNGIPVQDQAKKRKVSGSSQSSVLKTAMRNLLKERSVRADKANYDVIAHDKKVQHLNKHKSFWQSALDTYLNSVPQSVKQPVYQTIQTRQMLPDFQTDTLFDNTREPIRFNWFFDDWDDLLNFCKDNSDMLDAYTAACLAHNTLLNLYDFVERK